MKNIKFMPLFVVLLLANYCSKAQTITSNDYDKFVGTWRWVNMTDTVEFRLKKATSFGLPVIIGVHRYVKNGNVEQSSWMANDSITINNYTIRGRCITGDANKIKSGGFVDLKAKRNGRPELLYNSNGTITFKLFQTNTLRFGPPGGSVPKYQMPSNITLTKL